MGYSDPPEGGTEGSEHPISVLSGRQPATFCFLLTCALLMTSSHSEGAVQARAPHGGALWHSRAARHQQGRRFTPLGQARNPPPNPPVRAHMDARAHGRADARMCTHGHARRRRIYLSHIRTPPHPAVKIQSSSPSKTV